MQYKGGNYFPVVIACTVKEEGRVQVQTTVCTITVRTNRFPLCLCFHAGSVRQLEGAHAQDQKTEGIRQRHHVPRAGK